MVKKPDGSEGQLLQKVITVKQSNQIKSAPNDNIKIDGRIGPFNVFYQLKTDDGGVEENGYYRIVSSPDDKDDAEKIKWIKKEEVQIWATRFAIKPTEINSETTFKVDITSKGGGTAEYHPEAIPKDAKAYSFVLKADESDDAGEGDGELEVAFCVARIEDDGMNASLNQLGEMALEIAFVIEDGQYLTRDYMDEGKEFIEYIKKLAAKWSATIDQKKKSGVDVPVRMALISYSDVSGDYPQRRPEVLVPFTPDLNKWIAGFSEVTGRNSQASDTFVDGFSGIDIAMRDAGWSENSAKQIVVLGNGSFQRDQGRARSGPMPFEHYLGWLNDRADSFWQEKSEREYKDKFGENTAGSNSRKILSDAFQLGGNQGDELRRSKYIHCIHVGQTIEQQLEADNKEGKSGEEIINGLNAMDKKFSDILEPLTREQQCTVILNADAANPGLLDMMLTLYFVRAHDVYDQLAQADLKGLANSSQYDGYYTHMNPTGRDVDRVVEQLDDRIEKAIGLIADVSQGKEDEAISNKDDNDNEMTKPIFRIVGSELSAKEIIQNPVQVGTASLRDSKNGRSVGEKVVMVSQQELKRLGATLDSMYEKFQSKRKAAARQNIKNILDDLQESLAAAASGQEINENTELSELITDLPLRTEALRLTASDIAVMSTDAFDSWLEDVQLAENRSTELLDGDQERWISINGLEESASRRYAFLRLSELP